MATADPSSREYATNFASMLLEKLYLNENFADIHFVFDSGERIPAHKLLLATASDVFRAMFNGSYIEKTEAKIVDASADAFKEFLQFIYRPKAVVTMANVSEVMNFGKKYDIAECFNICGEFLAQNINTDDVLWIYKVAEHLSHEKLQGECEKYVERNTQEIFTSEGFLKCDRKTVKWILQMDSLFCSEVELFEALIKWIKGQSEQEELTKEIVQGQYGDLWHEVRFGSMTLDTFSALDPSYGALFTSNELREIIQMFNSEQFEPKIFQRNRRFNLPSLWDENAMIKCDRLIKETDSPNYLKNTETTTFTFNKPVLLGAFSCMPVFSNYKNIFVGMNEDLPSEITITKSTNLINTNERNVVLFVGTTKLLASGRTRIILKRPILIQPGFIYQIQMKQTPPKNYYTRGILKTEVGILPDISVKFHNDPVFNGGVGGLIDELHFNIIKSD